MNVEKQSSICHYIFMVIYFFLLCIGVGIKKYVDVVLAKMRKVITRTHSSEKKRFMLDEKFQRNASKFAIFYIYEYPKLLFLFFISCHFIFSPNECPGLCPHRPGHSFGKNIKLHEMKNEKYDVRFLITI